MARGRREHTQQRIQCRVGEGRGRGRVDQQKQVFWRGLGMRSVSAVQGRASCTLRVSKGAATPPSSWGPLKAGLQAPAQSASSSSSPCRWGGPNTSSCMGAPQAVLARQLGTAWRSSCPCWPPPSSLGAFQPRPWPTPRAASCGLAHEPATGSASSGAGPEAARQSSPGAPAP